MARTTGGLSIEVEGLKETLEATRGVARDLRPYLNTELRDAAGLCAAALLPYLEASAAASGVPVAPRVARSATVKRDRIPTVSIGGAKRVGRHGAAAGSLVWGSEHGPAGAVNHFAVPPGPGYWIAPAVERFKSGPALAAFNAALAAIIRKWRLF